MSTPAASTCIEAEPFALRVLDDSMEPEFARGCIVVIDPTGHARDGAFVLAENEDEFVLRRLRIDAGAMTLEALNPAYPALAIGRRMSVVKGVVVQRAGARRRYHKRYL